MEKKIIGIVVVLLLMVNTTTIAVTPCSQNTPQSKNQLIDTTPVPLPPSTGWTKTFGGKNDDIGYSVQQTTDGGYIIVGVSTTYGTGQNVILLIKTDSNGDETWYKTFGGRAYIGGFSVQLTTDGGYILTGYTTEFGAGEEDVWVIKTDSNGDETWNRTFGGARSEWGYSVQQTTDGGYIIAGDTNSYGTSYGDVWLLKTDTNGYETWNKTFDGPSSDLGIDPEFVSDTGRSVQQTTDGGYIIAGFTDAFLITTLVLLIKTDDAGNKIWEKSFGRTDDDYHYYGYSVQQTTDGGYIITGTVEFQGKTDVLLIKTDSNGDEAWNKTFGGPDWDLEGSVQQTTDGGYIVTGTKLSPITNEDIWLIKTDSSGDIIWDETYTGGWNWDLGGISNDRGNSVRQTSDGGYIIAGQTYSSGAGDVWLIKTDSQGKSKTISSGNLWCEQLFHRFPNAFPLLRHLMGY
jgi:hypothetical protein